MPATWKVISPKPLNVNSMRSRLEAMMRQMGQDIEDDFQKTVESWNHQPNFGPSPPPVQQRGHILRVEVSTDDEQYKLVDEGARRHTILPADREVLAYRGTFSAKTKPNRLRSDPGGKSGAFVFREWVDHPGFKARNFDETIQKRQEKRFEAALKKVMPRVAQASGHAL
jgi:hypothetical protein